MPTVMTCPWCDPEQDDDCEPEQLCRTHLAEHEGVSVAVLDQMDREEAADLADGWSRL